MNIGKVTDAFKTMGLFLLHNITAILFLVGLVSIVYSVFLYSYALGFTALGASTIAVSLILNSEQGGD